MFKATFTVGQQSCHLLNTGSTAVTLATFSAMAQEIMERSND